MLNYNPLSGLFKLNGTLDRITAMSTLSLLNVNLVTTSQYAGTGTDWNLDSDINSLFGVYMVYKDLTINYTGGSNYDITTSVIEHVCKFYKVSNSLYGSEINVDTPVRIALADIPGSSGSGNAYIDLIFVDAGVEYWSTGTGYLEYTRCLTARYSHIIPTVNHDVFGNSDGRGQRAGHSLRKLNGIPCRSIRYRLTQRSRPRVVRVLDSNGCCPNQDRLGQKRYR